MAECLADWRRQGRWVLSIFFLISEPLILCDLTLDYEYKVVSNERLNHTLAQFQLPHMVRSTIEIEGYGEKIVPRPLLLSFLYRFVFARTERHGAPPTKFR